MKILRQELDKEIDIQCYLIEHQHKLYFIHSSITIPAMNSKEFNEFIKQNDTSLDIVSIEDSGSINSYFHVDFQSQKELVGLLQKLDLNLFIDLLMYYSLDAYDEFKLVNNYKHLCIIYQSMFGSLYTTKILTHEDVQKEEFGKSFIYCDEFGYTFILFATVNNDDTLSDVRTYGFKKSYLPYLFNATCPGAITDDFVHTVLTEEEFSNEIYKFYKLEQFHNAPSVTKKVITTERKWKIKILLNPNYHISQLKKQTQKV